MAEIQINMENQSIVVPTVRLLQPTCEQIKTVAKSCYLLKESLGNLARYLAVVVCIFSQPESAEVLYCNYKVIFKFEDEELAKAGGSILLGYDFYSEYLGHIVQVILLQCKDAFVSFGIKKGRKDLLAEVSRIIP